MRSLISKLIPLSILLILLLPMTTNAALPPQYQAQRDLDVLVTWIERHHRVAGSLRLIDFTTMTVHFGRDCVAYFKREKTDPMVAGPLGALHFDRATCPVE